MGENVNPITIQIVSNPFEPCAAIAAAAEARGWSVVRGPNVGPKGTSDIGAVLIYVDRKSDGLNDPDPPVSSRRPTWILTQEPRVKDAVHAVQSGVRDYRLPPHGPDAIDDFLNQIASALNEAQDRESTIQPSNPQTSIHEERPASAVRPPTPRGEHRKSEWLACSDSALMVRQRADRAAEIDATVLITGPSGTGKTALARMIHAGSPRANRPMITVSCGALPRDLIESELFGHTRGAFTGATAPRMGRFEEAEGGTILLDEIGELPIELQPKLLNVLQDRTVSRVGGSGSRPVDVRVIAATNRNLESLIASGQFREDLYYRLNVVRLEVPPLAGRESDILALIDQVMRREDPCLRMTPAARAAMLAYPWPGNIRELLNVMERAAAFCEDEIIELMDLALPDAWPRVQTKSNDDGTNPAAAHSPAPNTIAAAVPAALALSDATGPLAGQSLQALERAAILANMKAHAGNRAAVARTLGVSEKTIYNKIKRYGLTGSS